MSLSTCYPCGGISFPGRMPSTRSGDATDPMVPSAFALNILAVFPGSRLFAAPEFMKITAMGISPVPTSRVSNGMSKTYSNESGCCEKK